MLLCVGRCVLSGLRWLVVREWKANALPGLAQLGPKVPRGSKLARPHWLAEPKAKHNAASVRRGLPVRWRAASHRIGLDEWNTKFILRLIASVVHTGCMNTVNVAGTPTPQRKATYFTSAVARSVVNRRAPPPQPPNPSLKRTRTGMPFQALISFWAFHVLPARAA